MPLESPDQPGYVEFACLGSERVRGGGAVAEVINHRGGGRHGPALGGDTREGHAVARPHDGPDREPGPAAVTARGQHHVAFGSGAVNADAPGTITKSSKGRAVHALYMPLEGSDQQLIEPLGRHVEGMDAKVIEAVGLTIKDILDRGIRVTLTASKIRGYCPFEATLRQIAYVLRVHTAELSLGSGRTLKYIPATYHETYSGKKVCEYPAYLSVE